MRQRQGAHGHAGSAQVVGALAGGGVGVGVRWLTYVPSCALRGFRGTVRLVDDWTTQKIDLKTQFDGLKGRKY